MRETVDPDLLMIGAEALGDDIGIFELVAFDVADALKPDGEGFQILVAALGEQRHDQRTIDAARKQHAHRHVGDAAAFDRGFHGFEDGVLPVGFAHRAVGAARADGDVPIDVLARRPSGSIVRIVAGGSFLTPFKIVRGAGTTACSDR
jgi:hypothetical protein